MVLVFINKIRLNLRTTNLMLWHTWHCVFFSDKEIVALLKRKREIIISFTNHLINALYQSLRDVPSMSS